MPEDELGAGADRIEVPNGEGPRIWLQIVPDKKSIKNRIHIDVHACGGPDVSLDTRRGSACPDVVHSILAPHGAGMLPPSFS